HTNMWLAGFSETNKQAYYLRVEEAGRELMEENGGAYELLSLNQTKQIFKGRTKEGLFEITQNFNYGELFHFSAPYADYVLRAPYKFGSITRSFIHYEPAFMKMMYPEDASDERKTFCFDDLYAANDNFVCLKFTNVFIDENTVELNLDDNQFVFGYADAILMREVALAELNRDDEGRNMMNIVRDRAKTP